MSETPPVPLPEQLPTTLAAPPPLIIIEGCEVHQLVGDQSAHLASGTLNLFSGSSAPPPAPELISPTSTDPTPSAASTNESDSNDSTGSPGAKSLLMRVGSAAFFLEPHLTTAFTHADNPRWYFFLLSLPSESSSVPTEEEKNQAVGSGSYVRLTLPEGVAVPGSALEKSRDAFEDVLIGRGFFSDDSVLSAADAIKRGIESGASRGAAALRGTASDHISSTDPTAPSEQATFSPSTHSYVESAASATGGAADMTSWAAGKFVNFSVSVGERVAGMLGIHADAEADGPSGTGSGAAGESVAEINRTFDSDAPRPPPVPEKDSKEEIVAGGDGASGSFLISTASEAEDVASVGVGNDQLDDARFVLMDSTAASSEIGTRRHTPALGDADTGAETSQEKGNWDVTKEAVSEVGSGVAAGAKELSIAAGDTTSALIEHSQGPEAADLAAGVGETAKNVGSTVLNVMTATSIPIQGGAAVYGAAKEPSAAGEVEKE